MTREDRQGSWAFFYNGRWRVNPPIVHPAFCVCETCRRRRKDNEWDREFVVRTDRVSPHQSEPRAIAYAQEFKRSEEARLRSETGQARDELRAVGNGVTFRAVMELYRKYQRSEGKRYDRDKFRIDLVESYFSEDRDPGKISKLELKRFREWLSTEREMVPSTVNRVTTVLVAAMNHAVREGLIDSHQLKEVRRLRVVRAGRPRTFTVRQMEVLLGEAMERFEQFQKEEVRRQGGLTLVPLRGIVLVAYKALLRPSNNFALSWEQLAIDRARMIGSFHIQSHKNADRGVRLEGPLAPSLLRYLVGRMPEQARGLIHPNPTTGKPFTNIRKSWQRLLAIANEILPPSEQIGPELDFYNLRHSGASHLAMSGADPVAIVRMMGDTSLTTVLKHYFNSDLDHMQHLVRRWENAGEVAGGDA